MGHYVRKQNFIVEFLAGSRIQRELLLGSSDVLSLHHPCAADKIIPDLVPMDISDRVDVHRDNLHFADVHNTLTDAHDVIPQDTDVHRDNLHFADVHNTLSDAHDVITQDADVHINNFPVAKVHSTGNLIF